MDPCCDAKALDLAALEGRQGRVLRIVLGVNAAMFCVEFGAGYMAGSTALLGDSLDMLGDSFVYAFSLYVLGKGAVWRARAALSKGLVMVGFGVAVLLEASYKLYAGGPPHVSTMVAIGGLALAANVYCFALLWRHRGDDVNLRSTWLCSRNDLFANGGVLVAAFLVARLHSVWPDVLVGAGIAALFLRTAVTVLRESVKELRESSSSQSAGEVMNGTSP